jgi:hypothetical protein
VSIFEKDCPQCASPNPVQAGRCHCGYCFDPELLHQTDAVEHLAQEERLYRDYLAARLVQAEAGLTVARGEASADPENQVKAAQALLAEQALNAARAELRALTARVSRETPRPRPAAPAPKAPPAPFRKGQIAKPVSAGSPAPVSRPTSAPKPAVGTSAGNTARATQEPGPVFRAAQAVKAETVMQLKKVEPKRAAPKPPPPTSASHARAHAAPPKPPVAAPRPVAAKKEAKTGSKVTKPRKECPHCTALVPPEATRCRCGFNLPTVTVEMPPVALDAETLAVLAQGLDLDSRR